MGDHPCARDSGLQRASAFEVLLKHPWYQKADSRDCEAAITALLDAWDERVSENRPADLLSLSREPLIEGCLKAAVARSRARRLGEPLPELWFVVRHSHGLTIGSVSVHRAGCGELEPSAVAWLGGLPDLLVATATAGFTGGETSSLTSWNHVAVHHCTHQ